MKTLSLAFACWFGLVAVSLADEPLKLDPQQPYSAERLNPVMYDVEFLVTVTAPYKTKSLRVWLPIPPSDRGQELQSSELTTFPESVKPQVADEPLFGNRFAYFEFANPQGAQVIRHKFRIRSWELRWQLDPVRVQAVQQWTQVISLTRIKLGKRVKALHLICISRQVFPAQSSIKRVCAQARSSSPSIRTAKHQSSNWRVMVWSAISTRSSRH